MVDHYPEVGTRGGGNKCCGTPAGWENILCDSRGNVAAFDFFVAHLHQQINPLSISFVCKTLSGCLFTTTTQTGRSASVNVGNFY